MDSTANHLGQHSVENRQPMDLAFERDPLHQLDNARLAPNLYERVIPLLFSLSRVRVLLVADGSLNFSPENSSLRTFVETLWSLPRHYVRFDITLAHLHDVSDDAVIAGDPHLVRSIKQFKFDNPSHFSAAMYDEAWLFGFATSYVRGQSTPSSRLSHSELLALRRFIDGGGGLFVPATIANRVNASADPSVARAQLNYGEMPCQASSLPGL